MPRSRLSPSHPWPADQAPGVPHAILARHVELTAQDPYSKPSLYLTLAHPVDTPASAAQGHGRVHAGSAPKTLHPPFSTHLA
jgi:hypothetical protein